MARERFLLAQPVWPLPKFTWVLIPLAILLIYIYPVFRTDLMERPFGRNGWMYGWPLSHMLLFFILGLASPRHWFVFFMLGVLWEIIEFVTNAIQWDSEYWYAISYDIVMNGVGLALGTGLGLALRKSQPSATRKTAVAFTLCAFIAALVLLAVDDSWAYTLDRTLVGEAKTRQGAVFKSCGVTKRCGEIVA
jgi:hypothetical protein